MESGTRRTALRLAGTAIVAVVALGLTPAVAHASPSNPSNAEIDAARSRADAVAAHIKQLSAQFAATQKRVDDATAASAIALDEYQSTEAAFEQADARAKAAAAAAATATAQLGVARQDVVAFARRSYMQGSTWAGASALLTADGPAQLIERAALLEAAGSHTSNVLDVVRVAQAKAARSDAVARSTLAQADTLKSQASDALTVARNAETSARAQATDLSTQKAALNTQLAAAQKQLTVLLGARAAAQRIEEITAPPAPAPTPAPPVDDRPPAGPGSASAAQKAIDAAMAYVGTPYAWGGGGAYGPGRGLPPDSGVIGFDCSGLTQYAYARAGIRIPRNSRAQFASLPRVSSDDLRPGDLVFWATDPADPGTIHHVAMYLGNGRVVQAPESGDVVKVSDMWWSGYAGAVRPSA
ncbi:MAG: NlpC/P60 family protein [Blastococcus sp.]